MGPSYFAIYNAILAFGSLFLLFVVACYRTIAKCNKSRDELCSGHDCDLANGSLYLITSAFALRELINFLLLFIYISASIVF